jgi:opacity protein-like surface antigen
MSKLQHRHTITWLLASVLAAAAPLAAAETHWYVVGTAGQASIDERFAQSTTPWGVNDDDVSANLELGYSLSRNFSLRAGYRDLGSFASRGPACVLCLDSLEEMPQIVPDVPTSIDFTAVTLSAVPRWPVTDRFALYGKVGVIDWNGRFSHNRFADSVDEPSGTEVLGGVGAELSVSDAFGVLLEYEASDLARGVNLGAIWHF